MKNFYLMLIACVFSGYSAIAQTWTGTTNTDWNTATNWSPAIVPLSTGAVIIPGSVISNNWPVFASAVTLNSINMQDGSRLDVNGYSLTLTSVNTYNYFIGSTINNSNPAADIVVNINTGSGGYETYFRSSTVNDNITFNLTGTNTFYEGDAAVKNTFNGNVTFNAAFSGAFYISHLSSSQYNGNLMVNRTVAGQSQAFNNGSVISGNFSFINAAGGAVYLGNVLHKTAIGGTINIDINYPTANIFKMSRLINQTTGGSISVQNSQAPDVQKDTLLVASLSLTGYRGSAYATIYNNSITGNVILADDASYIGGYETQLRSNIINGNTGVTLNGSNGFFDADAGGTGNQYSGNVTFNVASSASLNVSFADTSIFSGNLTITRTAAGNTQLFNSGGLISGNFSYTNNFGGSSIIGNINVRTAINGMTNISVINPATAMFQMHRIINQTGGGTVDIQNTIGVNLQKDTLLLNALSITGYRGNAFAIVYDNKITGNVTLADHSTYTGGYETQLRNNTITGNTNITINSGNAFFDADATTSGNQYNGDVTISALASGAINFSYADTTGVTGNLVINRTVAGNTQLFNSGGLISGNFSYTNNFGGSSIIGNINVRTAINGMTNISVINPATAMFQMHRIINQTGGGTVDIQNTIGVNLQKDTLLLNALSITGYRGNAFAIVYDNKITGNVTLADHSTYTGGYETQLRNNTITGNTNITINSGNAFFDADATTSGNQYNGDVTISALASGAINFSYADTTGVTGNLVINRTATGLINAFNSGGIIGGNFSLTNNLATNTYLGNAGVKTNIGGTVNITNVYSTPAVFQMRRIVNQTGGGVVNIQNSAGFEIEKDTMVVSAFGITGYRGAAFATFSSNSITGDVNLADHISYTGGYETYVRSNSITGNTTITLNGTNNLREADWVNSGNKYVGNVSFVRNGGSIFIGQTSFTEITQNLTLSSATGIILGKIRFNGATNGVIEQLGSQAIIIPEPAMAKTGTGKLTLNDPVTVSASAVFNGGNIQTSATNLLVFNDNVTYTGAGPLSHVQGPIAKIGDDAFIFPTGGNTSYNSVSMAAPALITDRFSAEYFPSNAHVAGYDTSLRAPALKKISGCEYWDVKRVLGTSNVVLTFSFAAPCAGMSNYINDPSALRVARWNGSLWEDLGNGGFTGTTTGTIITAAPVSNFSPFTFASLDVALNPLPLNLISFTGQKKGNTSLLEWKSENEINFSRFEIERSNSGNNFLKISTVSAKNIAGTNLYYVTDAAPAAGFNYYRLKQIDLDGKFSYSQTIKLFFKGDRMITIAPNPTHETVYVRDADIGSLIIILDMQGRKIITERVMSVNHKINVMALPAGLYMLRATVSGVAEAKSFIKE